MVEIRLVKEANIEVFLAGFTWGLTQFVEWFCL
ncbi:hypothetical protein OIU76_015907 [Salix suchowensis]|nr:hypothetical protein OIU76_015907 [Salix suchowensis]